MSMKRFLTIIFILLFLFNLNIIFAGGKKEEKNTKEKVETKTKETSSENKKETGEQEQQLQKQVIEKPIEKSEKKEKRGLIAGTVLDENGNPIVGVVVRCVDENGTVVKEVQTDKDGKYSFKDLPAGKYKIEVLYKPVESYLEIKPEVKKAKKPPIPTGLEIKEVDYGVIGESFLRVKWDKMENTDSYVCELYSKKDKKLIARYDGIKQNYCEFGYLDENKEYMIRVYSKNEAGISLSYALGYIKTVDKRPPPPYDLGYIYAKNNRIDLIWKGIRVKDLKGYVVQLKKKDNSYLFYSDNGLTWDLKRASVIKSDNNTVKLTISGSKDGVPFVENSIPYTFRVFEIDDSGNVSLPSLELKDVVLDDTVPPRPVSNIKYTYKDNKVMISWQSSDRDVVKYKVYYGVYKDRWDGVVVTNKNYYEFMVDAEKLPEGKLYIAITAVDRAGNESGFRPVQKKASLEDHKTEANFVVSAVNAYKDYSLAIKAVAPAIEKKKVAKKVTVKKKKLPPKKYGYDYLKKKGFVVKKGETALLTGNIIVPANIIIKVERGGRLNISNATIKSESTWGGIRFLGGSYGKIENTTIHSAVRGIVILDGAVLGTIKTTKVYGSKEIGVFVSNSEVKIEDVIITNCGMGIYSENSNLKIINSKILKNKKGIYAKGYKTYISSATISENTEYGLRLAGYGEVKLSSLTGNMVGAFFESNGSKVKFTGNTVSSNKIDGIVVENTNVEITKNEISKNLRYGIYCRKGANPYIIENNLIGNGGYAVFGGGKVVRCYVAFNNSSPYIDSTKIKGKIDGIFSSSSSDMIKQLYNVDYIENLLSSPVDLTNN